MAQPARITVLVPAHDEEFTLPDALASLRAQTVPPDRVLVVADNCTDATAAVAGRLGAHVVETAGNTSRKAGALNQVLATLLPSLDDTDLVLVMDADSAIVPSSWRPRRSGCTSILASARSAECSPDGPVVGWSGRCSATSTPATPARWPGVGAARWC